MTRRTRIKICGLTREVDVSAAVAAGADAIGFVLYERSPRHVTVERAAWLHGPDCSEKGRLDRVARCLQRVRAALRMI